MLDFVTQVVKLVFLAFVLLKDFENVCGLMNLSGTMVAIVGACLPKNQLCIDIAHSRIASLRFNRILRFLHVVRQSLTVFVRSCRKSGVFYFGALLIAR